MICTYQYFHFKNFFLITLFTWYIGSLAAFGQDKERTYRAFMFQSETANFSAENSGLELEAKAIHESQQQLNDSLLQEVRFWNAAYPSYRWHQIMVAAGDRTKGHKKGGRMAILHLAVYDAMVQVLQIKHRTPRKAPFELNNDIKALAESTSASSFICEYSAAAAASHKIIGHYFPEYRSTLDSLLTRFKTARLRSGLQYESDIEIGMDIGTAIAKKYIAYAKTDRTDKEWSGKLPNDKRLWSGTPSKWDPMKAQWKTLTLEANDQFRPVPPPSDWTADMEELRQFNTEHKSSGIAWKWRTEPVWDRVVERKILEYGLDSFQSAFANAVFHTARFDATIAAWDGKYHYWTIRPFQYDPNFEPILVDTPNFPGYPAGHTTVAGSLAKVLSHLFPLDSAEFEALANECSESRFEGGVHFRTDNEVGLEVGKKVGAQVWKAFSEL
jgi:hypothetical protein